ncbi:MAG: hypothetical protein AAF823_14025 [Planctomycetota bacterium]
MKMRCGWLVRAGVLLFALVVAVGVLSPVGPRVAESASSAKGTYEGKGPWNWKLGMVTEKGTHKAKLRVKGNKLRGKTTTGGDCVTTYKMKIVGGAKLGGKSRLKGSMKDACNTGTTTYDVNNGKLSIKENRAGSRTFKATMKGTYASGVDPGARLTTKYKGKD